MSKLEEFENFVERVRKYGLIPSSLSVGSKASIILLIDDLPVTNGKVAFQRLQNCLRLLVQTTRTPTAILITDRGKADSEDQTAGYLDELPLSLQSAGACKVTFSANYFLLRSVSEATAEYLFISDLFQTMFGNFRSPSIL